MRKGIDCNGVEWEERKLTPYMIDLRNKRFGRLTALFPVINMAHQNNTYWMCVCDCGNMVVRSRSSLIGGKAESCGCLHIENTKKFHEKLREEMIGQKYGKLVVNSLYEIKDGKAHYECYCDCGNKTPVIATSSALRSGRIKSCGCAKKDAAQKNREDLTGQRFCKLVVTGFAYSKDWHTYWNCDCDCGNSVTVKGVYLKNGDVKSCGCIRSVGELNIMRMLNTTGVEYLHDKGYFKDLVNENGNILRYDFILFDHNHVPFRLIEFDGPQHDNPSDLFGINEFKKTQRNDAIKNQYALSHNIPLIRIPYSKRDSMVFDDLFGDKYLI